MLSEEGCRGRRTRLWEALPREVQWVLVADPRHVNYLSGFWVNPVSFSSGERGFLYLERDGEAILLCDNFTLKSAIGGAFVDRTIVEPWYDHRHGVPNRDQVLFRALERIRDRFRPASGLLEAEWLPLGALEALGWPAAAPGRASPLSPGPPPRPAQSRWAPDRLPAARG